MAIRLASSCSHFEALSADNQCAVHDIKVNANYVCDRFSLKPQLNGARHCGSCARYNGSSCAHSQKAAEGMLCAS